VAVPSLEDYPREVRSKSASTPEIIKQSHDMLLYDRRMNVRKFADHYRNFKRTCSINITTRIGYEKALRNIGAAFAHSRSKTHSHENL
jgi:hypothetical protein